MEQQSELFEKIMSVHQQYKLIFGILETPILGRRPICDVDHTGALPHLQSELRSFLERSDHNSELVDVVIDEIEKILNGTWDGFEHEGDNFFYTETNESIKLDLNDGFAYLALDSDWTPLPKIPLVDLKAIFQEWVAFRNSVYRQ